MMFNRCKTNLILIVFVSLLFCSAIANSADRVVVIPLGGSQLSVDNSYFEQNRNIENIEDWTTNYTGSHASYTQTGATSSVSMTGNGTAEDDINFGKHFTEAIGLIGTINLANINKASAGFGMYVGMLNGNHIHTNINFSEWNGDILIRYKLRLRDSNNNNIKTLAWGYVPANDLVGHDVKVGFVKKGNAVHFYVNGESLFKWQPTDIIAPREQTYVWYWEWVDQDATASVSATFKNISIIE